MFGLLKWTAFRFFILAATTTTTTRPTTYSLDQESVSAPLIKYFYAPRKL